MPGNVKEENDSEQLEKELIAVAGSVELRLKKQLYSKLLFPDSYTVGSWRQGVTVSPGWP